MCEVLFGNQNGAIDESLLQDIAITAEERQRKLCSTTIRYLGWVPLNAESNDIICIFKWAITPFVLRPVDGGHYILIGECYMHGIMHGEALNGGGLIELLFNIR
jgi:hypothetical protein